VLVILYKVDATTDGKIEAIPPRKIDYSGPLAYERARSQ
jgi:hypothetical protein